MSEQEMRISPEIKSQVEFERSIQSLLDYWYASRGHTINRAKACKQFDCILDTGSKIEEKIRDGIKNDLLIEIVQDLKTRDHPGWFLTTGCDYLHYVFTKDGIPVKLIRIKWPKFRTWFTDVYLHEHHFIRAQTSIKGFGCTVNLIVPIVDIPKDLQTIIDIPEVEF